MSRVLLFLLFVLSVPMLLLGQDRAKWTVSSRALDAETYELTFQAKIQDGWTVYSMFMDDSGPVPTSITYDSKHQTLVGKAVETTSKPENRKEGFDELFEMNVIKYKKDLVIKQKVKIKPADAGKPVVGYVTSMACDHEQCMPPSDAEFSHKVSPLAENKTDNADTPKTDTAKAEGNSDTPQNNASDTAQVPEQTPSENGASSEVVPSQKSDVYNPVVQSIIDSRKAAEAQGPCQTDNATIQAGATSSDQGLGTIFLLGFLGGLVALLTPCVFPMVPLTVSYFTKRKANGMRDALIYAGSIVGIYVTLGLLVTIFFGESALNWVSTHWLPNTLFFILFIAFAISFFGYYDIKLPSSWSNKSDQAADKGGLGGIFFMAFTLSLVSFSCTGPIIGTLLVNAADGGRIAPITGMLGFSMALALPFGLFSAFPSWLQSLPRSGGWMNTIKVVLGFVEVALAFKFLSKADLTEHWGILKYETFMAVVVLSCLGLFLYLMGWLRFPHDDKDQVISWPRRIFGLLALAGAGYMATGFMVNPATKTYSTPALMSGLAPPACYSYACPCSCPAGIDNCFKDYYEGLAYAKKVNKPILLDFTGHGCENCRKMEDQIWVKESINKLLNEEYVLISLYVDDRTPLPKILQTPEGKKLRTTGSLWAAFQAVNFERTSQPWYVPMSPDEKVLTPPVGALFDEQAYEAFLRCGISNFKNNTN